MNMNLLKLKTGYRRLLSLLVLSLVCSLAFAQGGLLTIKGKVIDGASEEALIGVTVKEVGSNRGTITDLDGNFVLEVKPNSSVEFSYLSYKA